MKSKLLLLLLLLGNYSILTIQYRSAGVVPLTGLHRGSTDECFLFRRDKRPIERNLEHHSVATYSFSDLGAMRKLGEDHPAMTAARALLKYQKRFTKLRDLTAYITQSLVLDLGNGHITYFVKFNEDELALPQSAYRVMLYDLINIKSDICPGKYCVHDPTGCYMILFDKFAMGLMRNRNLDKVRNL